MHLGGDHAVATYVVGLRARAVAGHVDGVSAAHGRPRRASWRVRPPPASDTRALPPSSAASVSTASATRAPDTTFFILVPGVARAVERAMCPPPHGAVSEWLSIY